MVHSDSDERKELSCDDSIGSSYSGKVSSTTAFTNEIAQKLRATKVFVGTTFPLISMSQSATLLGKWNDVDSALIDIAKQTGSEIIADSRRLPKLLNVAEHRDMRSPESIDKLKQKSQYQSSDFAKLDSDYISSPSCSSSTSTSTSTKCSSSNSSSSNSSDSEKELINRFTCHKKRRHHAKVVPVAFTSAEEDFYAFMVGGKVEKFRRDNNREPKRQEMEQLLSCCY